MRLLEGAAGPAGFVAAAGETTDYGRVWARDGVICGLAGLLTGNVSLVDGLSRTLETLRRHQGRHGEIPSNVASDGAVSYGTLAGRVDCPLWYVIGVALLDRERPGTVEVHEEALRRALWLAGAWQFNDRGLIWSPLGGTWADESLLHGYVLLAQVLHLWALRTAAERLRDEDLLATADRLAALVVRDYWIEEGTKEHVHSSAYESALRRHGVSRYWCAGFTPAGYEPGFDGLANGLALLMRLGRVEEVAAALAEVEHATGSTLVPGFHPPIGESDPRWPALREYHLNEFRNHPGEYHNGGLWPMVTGFMAAGLAAAGDLQGARRLADGIDAANALGDWGFFEHHSATTHAPLGVRGTSWSAAAAVIARHAAAGQTS